MLDTALDPLSLHQDGIFLRDGDVIVRQCAHGYNDMQLAHSQSIPLTQRFVARVMAGAS